MTHRTTFARPAAGLAATALVGASLWAAGPASAETEVPRPDSFTSAYTVMATPDGIIDTEGNPAEGQPGATGTFDLMVNADTEVICYDITLDGVTGEYESPAKTATHIHLAPAGEGGPPRIAFPNPEGDGTRTASGCLQGPFTTGLEDEETGEDTGEGFTLADLEADPTSYSADTHTADYAAGAVRGQLQQVPVGGIDTGMGGGATDAGEATGAGTTAVAAGGAALVVGVLGAWLLRRRAAGV
ncbi:CHRD domain-containing protein [uncultured Nocardioides sp.]|uniref:CHRD domain-containing protein n=1 Tax=uncultured Nocardioides sp. TaxID=198441 RepID=UPI0026187196|nr:CHRD domain-containing protein [uncultured Nocardioides sp.]